MPKNNREASRTKLYPAFVRFTESERERIYKDMQTENMPSLSAWLRKVAFDHLDKKDGLKK